MPSTLQTSETTSVMRSAAVGIGQAAAPPTGWTYDDIAAAVTAVYDPRTAKGVFDVLEAGGGSSSHVPLPQGARITTIDISAEALAMNDYAHERLHGDLQTFDYGARRFDLIVVWDVLEHLERPGAAFNRLAAALKPSGRLLVVGPVPNAMKSLVTRFTPHSIHVLFYRHVLGSKGAGLPGHPPFAVHLEADAGPAEVVALARENGLAVEALHGFESHHVTKLQAKSRLVYGAYRAIEAVVSRLSRGRIERRVTDFFMVAVRQV